MNGVQPRARSHIDRAGDPLDGLVNLFDVAVVLAVAFLLVALTAVRQGRVAVDQQSGRTTIIPSTAPQLVPGQQPVGGRGTRVGSVYRLEDGRLAYVAGG